MSLILKLLAYFLVVFVVCFIIFCMVQLDKVKRNLLHVKDINQVFLFRDIYEIILHHDSLGLIFNSLQKKFRLITMHEVLSKVYSIAVIAIAPCIMVLCYMFLAQFTTYWYMVIGNVVISFIMPILFIKSSITAKSNTIYLQLAKVYDAFGSSLATNGKIDIAAERIITSTNGSVRVLFSLFKEEYLTDREEAYINFQNRVRDYYAESFCDNLMSYEESGVDPSATIHSLSVMAVNNYRHVNGNYKDMFVFKIAGIVSIAATILIVKMVTGLIVQMGSPMKDLTNTPQFYTIIVVECIYTILCFVFSDG